MLAKARMKMKNEERKIGEYSVLASFLIGEYEIALCESKDAPKDRQFLCGFIESNELYERLTDCMVSDSYADIAICYGERIVEKGVETQKRIEEWQNRIGENKELTKDECRPITESDSLENKVIVLRGSVLRPEFRNAANQLLYCVGGFGAQPNARGRTCFSYSLYDGTQKQCRRLDVLGVVPEEMLPQWAKDGLAKISGQSERIDRQVSDKDER